MTEPRWLGEDERQAWVTWVFASRLFWEEVERDLQRESGLPFGYYDVLVMLSESPGRRLRMSDLADCTQSSRSRLSHAVTRLEALGWVRREPCAADRRGAEAVLTDEGFEALTVAAPHHVESVRRHLFDVLTPEQQVQLADISTTLLDHLLPIVAARGDGRPAQFERAVRTSGHNAPD
ncbi:MAG: MarR family transcriptional regulator [Actinomycetes bacterium]